jgi:hypothetical protein
MMEETTPDPESVAGSTPGSPGHGMGSIDITDVIRQRLAWDIVGCDEVQKYWKCLDLIPPQADVAELAHQESHRRMLTVASMLPPGEVFIVLATDIISNVMIANMDESTNHEFSPAEIEQMIQVMVTQNREVVRGAFYPILAHMLENGYLQLGPNAPTVNLESE